MTNQGLSWLCPPQWPLLETTWDQRQTVWMAPSSPPSQVEKCCTIHIPLSEGHICTEMSTMAMMRFASSTTNHCCIQCDRYCAQTTSVWPTQALSKLLFGSGSMSSFMNLFEIILCLDFLKMSLCSQAYLDIGKKGLPCMVCGQRGPRMWFQTLAEDSKYLRITSKYYLLELNIYPNIC